MFPNFSTFAKDLLKEDNEPKFGCLMAMISPELSAQFVEWAFDSIDPSEVVQNNGKSGYENEPHITILYGFHPDVTHEEVFPLLKNYGPIKVKLGKISKFKQEDQDVLKFDVESQDLHELNALMMKKFAERVTNKYPEYHPHQTIAYVVKGAGEDIDFSLFEGFEMEITDIVYSYGGGEKQVHLKLPEIVQEITVSPVHESHVLAYMVHDPKLFAKHKIGLTPAWRRVVKPHNSAVVDNKERALRICKRIMMDLMYEILDPTAHLKKRTTSIESPRGGLVSDGWCLFIGKDPLPIVGMYAISVIDAYSHNLVADVPTDQYFNDEDEPEQWINPYR